MNLNKLLNIRGIISENKDEKLPASVAYKFMKFLASTEEDLKFFVTRFQEIINKYGRKGEDGEVVRQDGNIAIQEGKYAECQKELDELYTTEAICPSIEFTLEELGSLKLSVQEMCAFEELIRED